LRVKVAKYFNSETVKQYNFLLSKSFAIFLIYCLTGNIFYCQTVLADISEKLFFMGEDTEVLTAVLGRPEFPKKAPAVVTVLTDKNIKQRGIRTLAELLSQTPGFYSAQREWGHSLYLRGIPAGVLFLYDGVPLTSDSTKSIYPLDEELALAAIKQIEIVRGPASVLWGPDAFAGVLNIVPKTGNDINGIETGILLGLPHAHRGFYLNLGKDFGKWEGFLSLNAYFRQPAEKYCYALNSDTERQKIGTQEFYDLIFNLRFFDFLRLSGRISDFNKPYVMHGTDNEFKWESKKNTPFKLIKLEAKKTFTHTSLRFKTYFNHFYQKQEEMDLIWQQKNNIYYAELSLDRDLFNEHGLFSLGTSFRLNQVKDAAIETRGFLPDYLENQDTLFRPLIDKASFITRLKSIFCQYRHHLKTLEIWGGIRFDAHSEYHTSLTYNLGLAWYPHKTFYLKTIYGTAYRTPYASQFIGKSNLNPEEIKSFNLEINYHPFSSLALTLTPFYNTIHNHIAEDPFGGYSEPGSQKILGLETQLTYKPFASLKLWANATFLNTWGDKEKYITLDYMTITPEGIPQPHYTTWEKDYDSGAHQFGTLGIEYQLNRQISSFLSLHYLGKRQFSYLKSSHQTFPPQMLIDLTLNFKNLLPKLDMSLSLKNLLNKHYLTPGTFSPIQGNPFAVYLKLDYHF